MKKITSILLLVAVFATMLSMTAFAAGANTFTITTDVTSVAAGDTVIVTVEAEGDWADVAQVTTAINYDTEKFSVDTATDRKKGFKCYNADWYTDLDENYESNLGYITLPSAGENPVGQVNVVFLSMDGYTIDSDAGLYAGGTAKTAVIEFKALVDVETIDASCFSLVENVCAVESDALHTLTFNQIEAEEEEFTPETIKGAAVAGDVANIVMPKSEGSLNTNEYTNVAKFTATLGAAVNYSEAGFIFNNGTKDADKPFVAADDVVAGAGTFEYSVLMYAIPEGVTVTAIPYYVTAQ